MKLKIKRMTHFENTRELLSIIKSKTVRCRLTKEMENLIKLNDQMVYKFDIREIFDIKTNYQLSIYDCNNKINFEFTIYENYPFAPPKLLINNKPYETYLHIQTEPFCKILKKNKNINCFCCETILCFDNWTVTKTLKHIIDEFNYFKNICKEISQTITVDVIKRKYLNENINLIEWLH